jgi:two-component system chemotaxis response regulator CheB
MLGKCMSSVSHDSMNKPISVMIADDSAVVRGMLTRALEQDPAIRVVASVADGEMALSALSCTPVDIVLLDVEMPRMDGLAALPKILEISPNTKVIMASSLTMHGADVSVKALSLGASDCIVKPVAHRDKDALAQYYKELTDKIRALAGYTYTPPASTNSAAVGVRPNRDTHGGVIGSSVLNASNYPSIKPNVLAIASSTGGPQALLTIFKALKADLKNVPIFITQHMPANFTTILATNLSAASGRDCHEAVDGEVVVGGKVYIAPGNFHMIPKRKGADVVIQLTQDEPVNFCRPAADPMIDALVDVYGRDVLLLVLTGMGQDGYQGAKTVVERGGTVVAQDEASSVVWGMPRAVIENNLHRAVLSLDGIAPYLHRVFMGAAL